jgi:hypothetical protein
VTAATTASVASAATAKAAAGFRMSFSSMWRDRLRRGPRDCF